MSKFSRLRKLQIDTTKPIRHVLARLDGKPVLHLLPATSVNPHFLNLALKEAHQKAADQAKRKVAGGADAEDKLITADDVARQREEARRDYPGTCIVGWEKVADDDGKEVPFTVEDCRDFVAQLPDDIFDGIRAMCLDNENFRPEVPVDAIAKNS